jgi:hypothetical protein
MGIRRVFFPEIGDQKPLLVCYESAGTRHAEVAFAIV